MLFAEGCIWIAYAICQGYTTYLVAEIITTLISFSTVCLWVFLWWTTHKQREAEKPAEPGVGTARELTPKSSAVDTPRLPTEEHLKTGTSNKADTEVKVEGNKLNNSI